MQVRTTINKYMDTTWPLTWNMKQTNAKRSSIQQDMPCKVQWEVHINLACKVNSFIILKGIKKSNIEYSLSVDNIHKWFFYYLKYFFY